ncbi:sulfite exporter TauE/SafE family protein [Lutibacter sp. TH_r2]|uniref:sulfite exporter TauE/SafE family protein n=1 Tax=Lutibacter sp. TH_r2 TaxID=3082083 RepID=UPI0029532B15|nr:sulfite exporter TauE/SafE family protein [Lutibacter sp. TH_r2]MDV7188294.1 sulfite exporter TauE/SafE family protein [Lutibacter sp. TH_r2]
MQFLTQFLTNYSLTVSGFFIAFIATILLGMGKAGIKGIGVVIVLLMAFVFGGKQSTGVLLPLMIIADIFAVIYYHRHTQWFYLKKLLPSMFTGVLIGVWIGNFISETLFKQIMAIFILITVIAMIYMEKKKANDIPSHWTFSSGMGLVSGFTSMVGNLAGSFTNIYFLAMRLPKNEFIGTAAWMFFIINMFKLPFHIFYWKTVNLHSIKTDLVLIPAIIIGFVLGIIVLKHVNNNLYRKFIFGVTIIGAILILIE